MAKLFVLIGYRTTLESTPGVWTKSIVERGYYAELLKNYSYVRQQSQQINDNISISNNISILADPYAYENFTSIEYITFMGNRWKVSNVEVNYPRLTLTTGGLYNGQ